MSNANAIHNIGISELLEDGLRLLQQGLSEDEVQAAMVGRGVEELTAAVLVTKLKEMRAEPIRRMAIKSIAFGALWFVGGAGVLAISVAWLAPWEVYLIAWSGIIVGSSQFMTGLFRLLTVMN